MSKVNAGPVLDEKEVPSHAPDLYRARASARRLDTLDSIGDSDIAFFH